MWLERLCFGTSTFVAGRLRPDKDSRPGIAALRNAVRQGLQWVHSNPGLGTQWAIREAVAGASVRHLIKAEAALDATVAQRRDAIHAAIDASRRTLDTERLHAVVWEIDLKRTHRYGLLVDEDAVLDFYESGAELIRDSGVVDVSIAYCHSPAHLRAATTCQTVGGFAAQYNQAEPWPALYLDRLHRPFFGMSPLRRGGIGPSGVSWAAAHPAVTAVVITMSTRAHFEEVAAALARPMQQQAVQETARAWALPGVGR